MPDVGAIITGLRERARGVLWPDGEGRGAVLLPDAEAAVLAAVDARTAEIVEWLGTVEAVAELYGIPEARLNAEELEFGTASLAGVAEALARRFPNEGTNAPPVSGGDEGNTP